jgi:Amt family ammonium transporter
VVHELWLIFVYCPIAHWVWARRLSAGGSLDYAGGTVVHLNAGACGLSHCLVLGKRVGYGHENMSPHNLTLSVIGASLLWVGWFGFNAGSAVSLECQRGHGHGCHAIATAAASLSWMFANGWSRRSRPYSE